MGHVQELIKISEQVDELDRRDQSSTLELFCRVLDLHMFGVRHMTKRSGERPNMAAHHCGQLHHEMLKGMVAITKLWRADLTDFVDVSSIPPEKTAFAIAFSKSVEVARMVVFECLDDWADILLAESVKALRQPELSRSSDYDHESSEA